MSESDECLKARQAKEDAERRFKACKARVRQVDKLIEEAHELYAALGNKLNEATKIVRNGKEE